MLWGSAPHIFNPSVIVFTARQWQSNVFLCLILVLFGFRVGLVCVFESSCIYIFHNFFSTCNLICVHMDKYFYTRSFLFEIFLLPFSFSFSYFPSLSRIYSVFTHLLSFSFHVLLQFLTWSALSYNPWRFPLQPHPASSSLTTPALHIIPWLSSICLHLHPDILASSPVKHHLSVNYTLSLHRLAPSLYPSLTLSSTAS